MLHGGYTDPQIDPLTGASALVEAAKTLQVNGDWGTEDDTLVNVTVFEQAVNGPTLLHWTPSIKTKLAS